MFSVALCELDDICIEAYLHKLEAILRQIFRYSLIYVPANETGAAWSGSAVCVHFTLSTCSVDCTLFFSLICTGLAVANEVQSFCGFGPMSIQFTKYLQFLKKRGLGFFFPTVLCVALSSKQFLTAMRQRAASHDLHFQEVAE